MSDTATTTFICPRCGTANDPADRFCQECGAPLDGATGPGEPSQTDSIGPGRAAGDGVAASSAADGATSAPAESRGASDLSRPAGSASGGPADASTPSAGLPDTAPNKPLIGGATDPAPAAPMSSTISSGAAASAAGSQRAEHAAGRPAGDPGETGMPPRSVLTFGFVLVLGAIALFVVGRQVGGTETLTIFSFCAGPVGLVLLVMGLVRLGMARRN